MLLHSTAAESFVPGETTFTYVVQLACLLDVPWYVHGSHSFLEKTNEALSVRKICATSLSLSLSLSLKHCNLSVVRSRSLLFRADSMSPALT